ncbi:phage tail assembly chaperone, partial [Clostridium chrysemydis]
MSKLTDFLINNPIDELTEEVMISDRFKDGDKILKFKIKAVSPNEFSELQKNCTKVGKKGKVNFDSKLFNEELIVNYTIEPNFKDSDAIKKAGCMTPAQFLNKV